MEAAKETGRRRWLVVLGLAALVGGACLFFLVELPLPISFSQNPGRFRRDRMEAVVERVRALGVPNGQSREFRLDSLSDPGSLRPRAEGELFGRGRGAGSVWARRSASGALQVVIETRDLGHAGEYGFAFSEDPLKPTSFGGGWLQLDLPGHLSLALPGMKIDDSWWEVLYNLD